VVPPRRPLSVAHSLVALSLSRSLARSSHSLSLALSLSCSLSLAHSLSCRSLSPSLRISQSLLATWLPPTGPRRAHPGTIVRRSLTSHTARATRRTARRCPTQGSWAARQAPTVQQTPALRGRDAPPRPHRPDATARAARTDRTRRRAPPVLTGRDGARRPHRPDATARAARTDRTRTTPWPGAGAARAEVLAGARGRAMGG